MFWKSVKEQFFGPDLYDKKLQAFISDYESV